MNVWKVHITTVYLCVCMCAICEKKIKAAYNVKGQFYFYTLYMYKQHNTMHRCLCTMVIKISTAFTSCERWSGFVISMLYNGSLQMVFTYLAFGIKYPLQMKVESIVPLHLRIHFPKLHQTRIIYDSSVSFPYVALQAKSCDSYLTSQNRTSSPYCSTWPKYAQNVTGANW